MLSFSFSRLGMTGRSLGRRTPARRTSPRLIADSTGFAALQPLQMKYPWRVHVDPEFSP